MVTARADTVPTLVLQEGVGRHSLAGHWAMLRDASGRLEIGDVSAPGKAADFISLPDNLALGYSEDVVWLRFSVQHSGRKAAQWWLWMAPGFIEDLTLYVAQPEGHFKQWRSGSKIPLATRPVALPEAVFPVTLSEDSAGPVVMYLRLQSASTLALQAQWYTAEQYAQRRLFKDLLMGILLGLLGLAALISLLAALWLRQRFFYVTTAYLLCFGLTQIYLHGYAQYLSGLLWPAAQLPLAQARKGLLASALAGLHIAFVLGYLQPAPYWPRLTHFFTAVAWLNVPVSILVLAGVSWVVIAPYFFTVLLGWMSVMLVLFVLMLKHRRLPAQLMLLMFMPGLLAMGLQTLRNLGLLPVTFWTSNLWEYTPIFQVPFAAVVVLLRVRDEQRAMVQAQQRERAQRTFIDMMAHELRTPLAVVQTALGNLQARTAQDRPDLSHRFERIGRALKRLNTMVDNALVQRELEQGGAFQIQPTAPSELLEQVLAMVVTDERCPVQMTPVQDDTPVPMDADWITLALLNLIENAIKYSPNGGAVQVRCLRVPGYWVLEVADHGMGLPAHTGETPLFTRFYRSDEARQIANVTGMGLGLYLVQQVALAHGGSAQGCNRVGGGSIFTLTLPDISSTFIGTRWPAFEK
ncbi:MAG: hypothetical protein K2Q11_10615 [Burkholderiaceae bacterium]|nr:hypothetical protein [Burkholderiaceae bacterium]